MNLIKLFTMMLVSTVYRFSRSFDKTMLTPLFDRELKISKARYYGPEWKYTDFFTMKLSKKTRISGK